MKTEEYFNEGTPYQSMKPALSKGAVRRSITITLPLDIAETLQSLIDGTICTSDSNEFVEQMTIVLKKLDKAVSKNCG